MKALQITAPGQLSFVTLDPVPLQTGEVRIAVAAAGLCGSDLKNIKNPVIAPQTAGHEFSGVVLEVGESMKNVLYPGDRVTAFPMVSCMDCEYCLNGEFRDCDNKRSLGFQLPGAFAEEVTIDGRFVIPLKEGISYEQGALVEPLAVGYRLAKEMVDSLVPVNSHILLIGDGPIALSNIQSLCLFNYTNITVVGKHDNRLQLAKELGAFRVFNQEAIAEVIEKRELATINACVFGAPADETFEQLLPFLKDGGIVFPQTRIKSQQAINYMQSHNIKLGRAFAYKFSDFSTVMDLILKKKIKTDLLVSTRVELSEFADKFPNFQKSENASKIMILNKRVDEIVKKYKPIIYE